MFVVNKKQVDFINGKVIAEASTIQLPPGEWPDFISVVDDDNVGLFFQLSRVTDEGGTYYTHKGVKMVVFND